MLRTDSTARLVEVAAPDLEHQLEFPIDRDADENLKLDIDGKTGQPKVKK